MSGSTRRKELLLAFKAVWQEQRKGFYRKVHRSPVNWSAYNFDASPAAVSILMDERGLFPTKMGLYEGMLSFEIFTRLVDNPTEIDDEVMDELNNDVEEVIRKTGSLVSEEGNPLFARIHDGARCVEAHDATLGVQGLIVTMRIDF